MGMTWLQEPLNRVLDCVPDVLLISDGEGALQFANRQLATVFGYAADEILGRSVEQLIPHRFRAEHIGRRRQFTAESRRRVLGAGPRLVARRKDGFEFPVDISLEPISDGGTTLLEQVRPR